MAESFAAGLVGVVLDDRYRLDAVLGEGGMGAVFRATHLSMDRRVAVKLLKPHLTSDETQLQRFAREARSTLKVDSPHAVKVLDFGVTPQRDYYMVLEYLDGRTVQRELDIDGPFTPARAVHVARQALHALGAAHRSGLVHRDVKPDNLLLMRAGSDPDYTKVLDFGVAKLMEGAARSSQSALALTQTGMVFGTPEFMSPEQSCGLQLDGRSDLYSLAATVFAMVTGCGMFDAGSPIEWLTNHARTPAPHLADARPELAVYRELDAVLQRCLAKQRDQRPRDAEELDQLLAAIEATLARPPSAIASAPTGAAPALRATMASVSSSASSYLSALSSDRVAAGETLVPSAAQATSPERPGALGAVATTGAVAVAGASGAVAAGAARPGALGMAPTGEVPPARRSRGLLLAVGAVVTVSLLGVAVGIALTRQPAQTAPAPAPADAALAAPADAAPAAPDAALAPVPPPDAALAARDAGAPAPPDAAPAPTGPTRPGPRPPDPATAKRVEELLKAAEEARRAGNNLRYLVLSDEAHKADPRHVNAKIKYADALIVTGNKDRGCAELRTLKRSAAAREQARKAGCPTD
ncbi:MAG TPA: serine/threonine-protein kinase [Kofleriaceae bacterium]|nr:serine/threonine-protein kinase [Kofleriaceae bacterium]